MKPAIPVTVWSAKCLDCRSSRIKGSTYLDCVTEAGRHANRFPGHRIQVWRAELVDTFSVEDQAQLPIDQPKPVDVIPF